MRQQDEAQHYYALLDEYGLLDEDGGLFSNWSGVITIQEKSRPLTIREARTMTEGDVTVNGSACVLSGTEGHAGPYGAAGPAGG